MQLGDLFIAQLGKKVVRAEGSHAAVRGMRRRSLSSKGVGRVFLKQILLQRPPCRNTASDHSLRDT